MKTISFDFIPAESSLAGALEDDDGDVGVAVEKHKNCDLAEAAKHAKKGGERHQLTGAALLNKKGHPGLANDLTKHGELHRNGRDSFSTGVFDEDKGRNQ